MPYRRLHLPFQGDVTKHLDKKKSLQDLAPYSYVGVNAYLVTGNSL